MELDEYLEYVKTEQVIKANSPAHQLSQTIVEPNSLKHSDFRT